MNLYLIVDFILLIFVLVGLWVSLYRVRTTILGVITMTLSDEQKKIEIRRVSLIIFIFIFQLFLLHDAYINFNWISFFSDISISSLSIYSIFKLSPENYLSFVRKYHKSYYDGRDSNILGVALSEQEKNNKIKDISEKLDVEKSTTDVVDKDVSNGTEPSVALGVAEAEQEKSNEKIYTFDKFSDEIFNKLKTKNYLNFPDISKGDFISKLNESNEQLFKFRNKDEAKYFYYKVINSKYVSLERFSFLCDYSYKYFRKGIQEENVSDEFKEILKL